MKRTADTCSSSAQRPYAVTPAPGGDTVRLPGTSTPPSQANPQNPPSIASNADRTGTALLAAHALKHIPLRDQKATTAQNNQLLLSSFEGSYMADIKRKVDEGTQAWEQKAYSLIEPVKTLFTLESVSYVARIHGASGNWHGIVEETITRIGIDFLVKGKYADGNTLLHILASIKNSKWLEQALATERGKQSLVLRNHMGYTALHYAAMHGRKKTVQLLLAHDDAGLLRMSQCEIGKIALHLACGNNHESVVKLLLSHKGMEQRVVSSTDGWLPIHSAVGWGPGSDVLPLLLAESGAEQAVARTKDGRNALMMAANRGLAAAVTMLLAVPGALAAQLEARDNNGKGAISHARVRGKRDVIAQLEAAMQTQSATSTTSTSAAPLASTVNQGTASSAPFPPAATKRGPLSTEKQPDLQ